MHILKSDNTKLYVGITSKKPEERWKKNGAGYNGNTYFHSALAKYGFDSFEHIIFASCLTQEEAESMEKTLIQILPKNGYHLYNTCAGGRCSNGRKGHKNTLEHNKKISIANKGKVQSEEQKNASRQRCLERKSGWYSKPGVPCPFKAKTGKDNCRAHEVYVFNLNWELLNHFDTITEASRYYNIANASISNFCLLSRKIK